MEPRDLITKVKMGNDGYAVNLSKEDGRGIIFKPINFYAHIFSGNYNDSRSGRSLAMNNKKEIKKRKRHHHHHQVQFLPRDVQAEIIARVPVTSMAKLRYVSRDWYTISMDNPLTVKKKACIVVYPAGGKMQVHLIEKEDRTDAIPTIFRLKPLPWNIIIIGSSNGIICFREESNNIRPALFLYNPIIGEKFLRLPKHPPMPYQLYSTRYRSTFDPDMPMSNQFYNARYGFGFDHTKSEFKVVIFLQHYDDSLTRYRYPYKPLLVATCNVTMVGGKFTPQPWKTIELNVHALLEIDDHIAPLVNGKLHYLVYQRHEAVILSFNIATEEIVSIPLNFYTDISMTARVGNIRSRLSITLFDRSTLEFWMMNEYGDPNSWTKQFSFSNKLIRCMIPCTLNEDEILISQDPMNTEFCMIEHSSNLVSMTPIQF